jgi:hypothetical protein
MIAKKKVHFTHKRGAQEWDHKNDERHNKILYTSIRLAGWRK